MMQRKKPSHLDRAHDCFFKKEYQQALTIMEEQFKIDKKNNKYIPYHHLFTARCYEKSKNIAAALSLLENIKTHTLSPQQKCDLYITESSCYASLYIIKSDNAYCILAKKVLENIPEDLLYNKYKLKLLRHRIHILSCFKENKTALMLTDKLLLQTPSDAKFLAKKAALHHALGQNEKAHSVTEYLDQIINPTPTNTLTIEKNTKQERQLSIEKNREERTKLIILRAVTYTSNNSLIQKVSQNIPTNDAQSRLAFAITRIKQGCWDEANKLFNELINDFPHNWQAQITYAVFLIDQGKEQECINRLKKLISFLPEKDSKVIPPSPLQAAQACSIISNAYYELGDQPHEKEYVMLGLEYNPNYAPLKSRKAKILPKGKKKVETFIESRMDDISRWDSHHPEKFSPNSKVMLDPIKNLEQQDADKKDAIINAPTKISAKQGDTKNKRKRRHKNTEDTALVIQELTYELVTPPKPMLSVTAIEYPKPTLAKPRTAKLNVATTPPAQPTNENNKTHNPKNTLSFCNKFGLFVVGTAALVTTGAAIYLQSTTPKI